MPKLSILLVEDNPDDVHILREALDGVDAHLVVHVAGTIADAWALLTALPVEELPSLLVTDHHLPDGGGEDLLAHLRTCPMRAPIPMVMVSGDAVRPSVVGTVAWFTKPDTWAGWCALAQELITHHAKR